jgi:hypothetical protein
LTLDSLLKCEGTDLDIHTVDVKRLRDDRSPIVAGEEIMFVAVAKFRLMCTEVNLAPSDVAAGDDVLAIGDDADLVSRLPIATEADVAAEIARRYTFKFSVNGQPIEGHAVADEPPWILRLDTSVYATEYIKVEVDVEDNVPEVAEPPPPPPLIFALPGDQKGASLELSIDGKALGDDGGSNAAHVYTLQLRAESSNAAPLTLRVKVVPAARQLVAGRAQ